ncbi:hypothetical protein LOAG_11742 [Loa loa]|uniref:Conserved secreted protein n=1 Tax=Loa loa TaxID=7209 RepID=A0A1I7W3P0_LOALO|nr:hypothetical protein LOAG_11742 [Loa loa]EFO16761.2 hypothetical protein LOAG_11742 [Loa loa]
MDLKYLAILTFIVNHVVSSNITSAGGTDEEGASAPKKRKTETKFRYPNNKLVSALGQVGHMIVSHLPREDLRNLSKAIPVMSEYINCELNRRRRILHYRDGEITPSYLKNALEHRKSFAGHHWTPTHAILFGGEKPINVVAAAYCRCSVLIFTSHKDHLKIQEKIVLANDPYHPDETKGGPMNGVVIPYDLHLSSYDHHTLVNTDFHEWQKNRMSGVNYLKILDGPVKLAIVISNDLIYTDKGAESEALDAAKDIRRRVRSAPICVVAQSDNRENAAYINPIGTGRVLIFHGSEVNVSTLSVNTNNSEMLKRKFEDWKKELLFFNTHQVIAFHFTVVNGTEPEDSEKIFRNTFPDIPLSTLRLLDESSMTGVNYEVRTEFMKFHLHVGPIYAIVGFRKFGEENPVTEDLSEEND